MALFPKGLNSIAYLCYTKDYRLLGEFWNVLGYSSTDNQSIVLVCMCITLRSLLPLNDASASPMHGLHGWVGGGVLHVAPWLCRLWWCKPQGSQWGLGKGDSEEDGHGLCNSF